MPHNPAQARLLVIDDDLNNLKLIITQLRFEGFQNILQASSGTEALQIIADQLPDIILLDVMMPDLSGLEVTKLIRANYPDRFIPIVLISSLQDPQDRVRGLAAGANDFISRPVNSSELAARLTSLLALKHARDELDAERDRLALLYRISQTLAAELDIDQLIQKILSITVEVTGADKAILVLLDDQGSFQVKFQARQGQVSRRDSSIDPGIFEQGLLGWVLDSRQSALVPDVTADARWLHLPDDDPAGTAIAVPLIWADRLAGALMLVSATSGLFTEAHLDLLTAIGSQAAIALENARLFAENLRQRARTEALLNQTGDPVIVLDSQGVILSINPAARRVLSLDETALGQPIGACFHLTLADLVLRAQERDAAVSGVFTRRPRAAGEDWRVFNVSVSPVQGVGYVMVWQDITSLKESEQVRLDRERAETRRILQTFTRYMSPALVERVLGDPDILGRRERREAVVLFADLRGFTRLTMQHPPDAVVALLNDIFAHMMEIVYGFEGVIFDIAGDELLVAFNIPYDQADAPQRALQTALAMQRGFAGQRSAWAARGMAVGMGIGLSRGQVVLGNVGGHARMNYAMIGQTVNIAHRLVEFAGDGQIVLTPDLLPNDFDAPDFRIISLPALAIKGIDQPVQVALLERASSSVDQSAVAS